MFTQCAKCETVFKLSAEVLRAAGGQVRCGRCGEVFNALARLAEDASAFSTGESPLEMETRADEILHSAVSPRTRGTRSSGRHALERNPTEEEAPDDLSRGRRGVRATPGAANCTATSGGHPRPPRPMRLPRPSRLTRDRDAQPAAPADACRTALTPAVEADE